MDKKNNWYYAIKGQRTGPLGLEQMKSLVEEGTIAADTKVWSGNGEWCVAGDTVLAELFAKQTAAEPPPLAGAPVGNQYVWACIAVIVIVSVAQVLDSASNSIWSGVFLVGTLLFLYFDERKVRKAGYPSPVSWWMLLFLPAYFWRRAKLLGQKKHHFWIWLGTLVLSVALVTGVQNYQQQQGYTVLLEQSACPLVTQIIQKQLGGTATCIQVTLGKEMSAGFYDAAALLDNGHKLRITVQDTKDGNIEVKVPAQ